MTRPEGPRFGTVPERGTNKHQQETPSTVPFRDPPKRPLETGTRLARVMVAEERTQPMGVGRCAHSLASVPQ
jgi:hypothetical protein